MKIKVLVILIVCFLTSGCWNYNELNDFAIVTGMGIDKHENGYKVSLMISNSQSTQSSAREGQAQTTVFTGTGSNITEALVNIEVKNPRNLYLGHLAVSVIDENIAKEDINPILEALMRNPESAKKYFVIIARENKAEDILKSLSPLEFFPSQNIALNIRNSSQNQGIANETILSDFIIDLLKPGVNPILPSISIQGDPKKIDNQEALKETEPASMLKIRSIGLFKNYKLVTWTTEKESQGINIVNNSVKRMYLTNKIDSHEIVVLIDKISTKIDVDMKDKLNVVLNISVDGAITEMNKQMDLEDPKNIEKINDETEVNIKKMVYEGINLAKKYKTDVFGFGNIIYKDNVKYWNQIKDQWDDEYFPNLKIKIKTDVNLKTKGSLENTIKEEKNED